MTQRRPRTGHGPGKPLLRNRYRVVERLGRGGGGSVYAVQDLHASSQGSAMVALKVLFPQQVGDSVLVEALRREFGVLASLQHPRLARVYDFGRLPAGSKLAGAAGKPGYFFTRDLIAGRDLARYAKGKSVAEVCLLFQRAAELLDVLHRAGMVHGDFKPANVIVDAQGEPHLIDFGLSQGEGRQEMSGTAAYMAPERLKGERSDGRADLYSLGISLYQVLAGGLPLPRASVQELLSWHLDGPGLRLGEDGLGLPMALQDIVQRLTQRDPRSRFPTAAETAVALSYVVGQTGPASKSEIVSRPRLGAWAGSREALRRLENFVARRSSPGAGGDDQAALISVVGDPGSGKTTLLRELAWRGQLDGREVLRASAKRGDRRVLGALRDIAEQVRGLAGGDDPFEAYLKVSPGGLADDSAGSRFRLYQRIADLVVEAARRYSLVLMVDGLEQADAETVEALRYLSHSLDSATPASWVVAHASDGALAEALGSPTEIEIAGLTGDEIAAAVAALGGRRDPEAAAAIHQSTGGNPRFVEEVLIHFAQAGLPSAAKLRRFAAPKSLGAAYRQRVRQLPYAQRSTLEALAVVGHPAGVELLTRLVGAAGGTHGPRASFADAEQLEALRGLEEAGWVERDAAGDWGMRQGGAAGMVYAQIDDERAAGLHRAMCAILQTQDPTEVVERTRHALASGDARLAWPSLGQALQTLLRLCATRAAVELAESAVSLAGPGENRLGDPTPAQLRLTLGRLQRQVGDYQAASTVLSGLVRGKGEPALCAKLEIARVYRASGQTKRALENVDKLLAAQLPHGLRLHAHGVKAAILADLDHHAGVLQVTEDGIGLARKDPHARSELRAHRAWSLGHLQRFEEATRTFALALKEARRAGDQLAVARILNRWAVISWRQGDYDSVEKRYAEALTAAEQEQDVERAAAIRLNLGAFYLQRGEYARARGYLEDGLRQCEAMGARQRAASARCNLGQLQLDLGLYEQARATVQRARDEMVALGRRSGEALSDLLLAIVAGRHGALDQAREGIHRARLQYKAVGQPRDAVDALLDLADLELGAGNPDRALRAVVEAREEMALDEVSDLRIKAATLWVRATVRARVDGEVGGTDFKQAGAVLRAAHKAAVQLAAPRPIWQCEVASMEVAAARGDRAAASRHARKVAAVLGRMAAGLPADVARAFWSDPWRTRFESRTAQGELTMHDLWTIAGDSQQTLIDGQGSATSSMQSGERIFRLLEIYRRINAELDTDRLLGMVMDAAVELTGAERGFLLLADARGDLQVETVRNLDPRRDEASFSRTIAEEVFGSGQPVVTVSARQDPRFMNQASVHQLSLESVLCIPIHARNKPVGVLYMESGYRTGRFDSADQRLLLAFGDQVAIALTNARLYEQVRTQAAELEQARDRLEALATERGRLLATRSEELDLARQDLAATRRRLQVQTGRFELVGRSQPMLELYELIERVAPTDVPVLIEGESGSGKEMVARALHGNSPRKEESLVCINCAAIPEGLLESELFGHVKGAFTGADRERKGVFAAADRGSLFLDEIGDMPPRMQVNLLRALQEGIIRPVGGQRDIKVDVRVLAATNKPLAELVQNKTFREDLYYRLHVVRLDLPPLRQRVDDLPLLVDHFLGRIAAQLGGRKKRLTPAAMRALAAHGWPGNVRQLEHALMNAAVLASGPVLDAEDFALAGARPGSSSPHTESSSRAQRQRQERNLILAALERCAWNKSRAAEQLGIPRRTFYRRLQAHGIE